MAFTIFVLAGRARQEFASCREFAFLGATADAWIDTVGRYTYTLFIIIHKEPLALQALRLLYCLSHVEEVLH
jgi:hypothetical protein